jgi:nucleoside-diphosphate kinase
MEKTLLIFKPDSFENKCVGEVLQHFEENGFELCACKMTELSSDLLRDHYAHLIDLPHFPMIVGFMSKRPVIILVLQTENAVKKARDLIGPTDSKKAEKGTIRGDFGTDLMRNVVHASDSVENAKLEIKRFFSSDEVYDL